MKKRVLKTVVALFLATGLLAGCGTTDASVTSSEQSTESVSEVETVVRNEETGEAESTESVEEEENPEEFPDIIRVGVLTSTYIPFLTRELGYFEEVFGEENTTVELVLFTLGPPMVEAMNSGELDIACLGDLPAFTGLANGGAYTIIGKYSVDTAKALVVRKDAGIDSLEDLKGHTYAVPFGSNIQPLAEIFLEEAGLTHEDVEYTNLSLADINTCLISGDIDAAVSNEPNMSKLLAATDEVEIIQTADGYKIFVGPIIGSNSFLEKYPQATATLLGALQKAADWSHENPEEAVSLIAQGTGLDEGDVQTLFDIQDNNVYLTEEQIQGLVKGAEDAYKYDLLLQELDVTKYIDTSYAELAGINEN